MNNNILNIPAIDHHQMITALREGRKINAIKFVKNASGCGLREAKIAVERLSIERGFASSEMRSRGIDSDALRISCGPKVIKVILDYGTGPVELDLETMQIKALSELHVIGVDACADILDLVDVFKAISEGKKVEIVDDETE